MVFRVKFLAYVILAMSSLTAYAVKFDDLLQPNNLKNSWINATVYEPNSFFPKSIDFLDKPSEFPVLIYLHGCAGLNDDAREWARAIKSLGFIVIQPDSFAIPGRRSNCDPKNHQAQVIEGFDSFRLRNAELRQAREELHKLKWLDRQKIFLMGHSEGGMTVSRTPVDGFRAVIASGYWCHERLEIKHGSAPFLFLNWESDPWFRARANNRNPSICQQHADQRQNTKQIIISGEGHATSGSSEARKAVQEFLRLNQ
jgi:dienelactone hydrolase